MIISTACERELPEFRELMKKTDIALNSDAKDREDYYLKRTGQKLEEDVTKAMNQVAVGTPFAGTIKLVSGHAFPDIVAKKMFGVEVKSTEKNHWTSTGSSILETTRNKDVERIYMTFGKLGKPVEFLSKPYEECLSDIAVTHMPRYRIDMKLQERGKQTIFEKMGIEYDDLRLMDKPTRAVASYYKSQLKEGESLWWAGDDTEETAPMTARLFSTLKKSEKDRLLAQACALFPEMFSKSPKKYERCALWMATRKGVICTNIRDGFSAGGRVEFTLKDGIIIELPQIYSVINQYRSCILEILNDIDVSVLNEYWKTDIENNRIRQWCELASVYAEKVIGQYNAQLAFSSIFPEIITSKDENNQDKTAISSVCLVAGKRKELNKLC